MVVIILLGVVALSPFLAPLLMDAGLILPGKVIYWIYSFLCHQLPERSYFLFGPNISYGLTEIQSAWQNTSEIAILRQFIGNPQMGWKVAWSDRMVAMYTSLWVFSIAWGFFRRKLRALPWWGLLLILLPMAVDGTSHMISDLAGIGSGFRDTNLWLAALTNNSLPVSFYAGDAWGSFNAWMRLVTGVLFGLGIVWAGFPFLEDAVQSSAELVEFKRRNQSLLRDGKDYLIRLAASEVPGSNKTASREGKQLDQG